MSKLLYDYHKQIVELKNNLNKTDYKSIKTSEKILVLLAEKFLSESNPYLVAEYLSLTAQRQEHRDEINELEAQIEELKNKQE